jgi:hypothetical protein
MPGVFVSYRRDDSQGFAGRLADDLDQLLGADQVFRDVEIPVGSDFSDVLYRAIAGCDLLLVVIGRRWAGVSADGGRSRLFEANDWVRTEIEAAFAQSKQVVPVLVGGAAMPAAQDLPPSIARLAMLQAATLGDRHWDAEVRDLAARLRELVPALRERHPDPAGDSPAQALRELGERVLAQVAASHSRGQPPPASPPGFAWRLLSATGRRLGRLLGGVVTLALVYAGLRLFGDGEILAMLDAFEARLRIGWERLLRWSGGA